ncbi:MAG: hypothetical protein M3N52_07875, partial [Actinomycetota bacterium]|nr:hypothetical protein [Actinomycetota bacterium]
MRSGARPLRLWWKAVAVLCAAWLPGPAAAGAAEDPRSRLGEVDQRLAQTRGGLDHVERRQQATLAELAGIDARLAVLDQRLAGLTGELAAAQGLLDAAEASLARTTQDLLATQDRLTTARADLAAARRRFAGRARASYAYGGAGYAATMLDTRDIGEFGRAMAYVRAVMASDRRQVERIVGLQRTMLAHSDRLETLQERQIQQRAVAGRERDRVGGLVVEQQSVRRRVQSEAQRQRGILARLEA